MTKIRIVGDNALSNKCEQVNSVDDVKDVIDALWDKVTESNGAGLSANQIGYNVSVAVINNVSENEQFVIINPEILEFYGDSTELREGCLSIPGVVGNVKRHLSLKLKYMDENGVVGEGYFVGNSAHIIQHEVEHLNGKLYIDNYGKIRRDSMLKKHKKALKKSKGEY